MNWYYAENGQQVGPMPEAQLDALALNGTITEATLVWCDGMAEWQPLSTARPSAVNQLPPVLPPILAPQRVAPQNVCVECGLVYAPTDLIKLNNSQVCATCKPRFIQRMMEGGATLSQSDSIWKSGREVVVRDNAPFPDRCVRCNEPANGYRLKRELSWHPPAYLLLILVGLLVYFIVAMIVRKKATLHIGLCAAHRAQRKRDILIASLTATLGVVLLVLAAVFESGWLALTGLVMMIGGGIYGGVRAPIISVTKIENNIARFRGAGKPFLESLPDWTGPK